MLSYGPGRHRRIDDILNWRYPETVWSVDYLWDGDKSYVVRTLVTRKRLLTSPRPWLVKYKWIELASRAMWKKHVIKQIFSLYLRNNLPSLLGYQILEHLDISSLSRIAHDHSLMTISQAEASLLAAIDWRIHGKWRWIERIRRKRYEERNPTGLGVKHEEPVTVAKIFLCVLTNVILIMSLLALLIMALDKLTMHWHKKSVQS